MFNAPAEGSFYRIHRAYHLFKRDSLGLQEDVLGTIQEGDLIYVVKPVECLTERRFLVIANDMIGEMNIVLGYDEFTQVQESDA